MTPYEKDRMFELEQKAMKRGWNRLGDDELGEYQRLSDIKLAEVYGGAGRASFSL